MSSGGEQIASVLKEQGVRFLFTLCGGHISPILVGAKALGIRIVDVRDEANAVFAADGVARLTGVPGVAAVTAGPGVTNTLTAVQNAMLAQSPLVLLGGSAATMLKGRGALQDIDQLAVIRPHVKWASSVKYVQDLAPTVRKAFDIARSGVPGPVFVECPIDLLYDEAMIRDWYQKETGAGKSKSVGQAALQWYMERHVDRMFEAEGGAQPIVPPTLPDVPLGPLLGRAAKMIEQAERPVLLLGSQAVWRADEAQAVAHAVERLDIPCFLASMARGLLGVNHPLQLRHKRGQALKQADLVILAGVACDFRLKYGRAIGKNAKIISVNLSMGTLVKNRVPSLPVPADPGRFIQRLSDQVSCKGRFSAWRDELRGRDDARNEEIAQMAKEEAPPTNPLQVCQGIEKAMGDKAVIVADGGDFVATASYIVQPRGPLRWLDPGVFGTLGVGGGFALAAALVYPDAEVWLIYGDGAAGFSLIEYDTFVRHGLPVIAVVGNDAGWAQIARDQVVILKDDVATKLARTPYDKVIEGLGGTGLSIDSPEEIEPVLQKAKALHKEGKAVLVNANIGTTEFRKGSISM